MSIKFLADHPALFITELKTLVIADLHIGLEHELYENGIIIPPQSAKFQRIISHLIEMTKAKILVIMGDIKHEVPGMSYREQKEIPKLFNHLIEKVKVICCLGNHDTFLQDILPKEIKLYPSKGFSIGRYGFFHGHAWPSKKLTQCDYLFMAHTHPAVEFKDSLGYRSILPVWVKGELNQELVKKKYKIKKCGKLETIMLPAFNNLLGGAALNSKFSNELIGPLLKNKFFDLENCKIYLLDGTFLGKIGQLKR